MATNYYNGCQGDLIFEGDNAYLSKWEWTGTVATQQVAVKGSGGFSVELGCTRSGSFTFEGAFDKNIHQGDPPMIYEGITGAFELELEDGGVSISGTCLIKEFKIVSDSQGFVQFSGSAATIGPYFLPGESTS